MIIAQMSFLNKDDQPINAVEYHHFHLICQNSSLLQTTLDRQVTAVYELCKISFIHNLLSICTANILCLLCLFYLGLITLTSCLACRLPCISYSQTTESTELCCTVTPRPL